MKPGDLSILFLFADFLSPLFSLFFIEELSRILLLLVGINSTSSSSRLKNTSLSRPVFFVHTILKINESTYPIPRITKIPHVFFRVNWLLAADRFSFKFISDDTVYIVLYSFNRSFTYLFIYEITDGVTSFVYRI
ncbi:hypothetical protein PBCV1_a164L [Paramecium bursaria Chlorella virus 1]|uniref:Uncharacterized protein n=1 Tax=Paramecium bursaria Chlorella virus 1 TaxID=10506 RepID=Q84484_PBCV1|nr:hypothetical protein PBCV1_a164L [Paramecium bursaria Chlorella virus 1]AAC96532.1 hypothetical protein [Paramecium bursaria Chlorella virus 1]